MTEPTCREITTNGLFSQAAAVARSAFDAASLAVCEAISALDFSERPARVLHMIRRLSFGRGYYDAHIDGLKYFAGSLGISKGNVSEVLGELLRQGVIEVPAADYYGFCFPIDNWKVPPRAGDRDLLRQLELLDREPSLPSAMRETFVESCGRADHGLLGQQSPARPRAHERVPELGTMVPLSGKGFLIREQVERPEFAEGSRRVPDSGTAHVHEHVREEHAGYSMIHVHALALKKVYEVGTAGKRSGAEILEEVKRAGVEGKWLGAWVRRIGENPALVWQLAGEARTNPAIANNPGWMNRSYMREMGLGKYGR